MRGTLNCLLTICLLVHLGFSNEITKEKLKDLLTPLEWSSLLQNSGQNYYIIYPSIHVYDDNLISPENKSNKVQSKFHRIQIESRDLGKKFDIDLKLRNNNLMTEDVLFLETFANRSRRLDVDENDKNCYFRNENAALSLCQGIRGILYSNEKEYFLIHPLPDRFHNETKNPHLLIKKTPTTSQVPDQSCVHGNLTQTNLNITKDFSKINKNVSVQKQSFSSKNGKENGKVRKKRDVFPDGAPAFVETAVFVDRDLFEHMKSNFPHETEREVIRFVLAMINAVQLLYHDPSLGRPVNFVLKRLEILKEDVPGLIRPPDIDRFLSNFCNWQRTKNPAGDSQPLHWDHALILTGLDLYVRGKHGKISNQVVGLAPVAGMCTATSSCTVNEGRHFESVYVVAHEIGHNLGMRHDGPLAENDCDPSTYIMSPTLGSGKITWSACSRRYLQKFLDTPQSRCLLDHSSSAGKLDHSAEGALPGERFDANHQCMLKYGKGSRHSGQQPLNDVCRDLHCERERYTWTSHPALEGTVCGDNMWCRGGKCVLKGLILSSAYTSATRLGQANGGWSKWKRSGDCASGCLFGEEGRLRSGSTGIMVSERVCNNPRPQGSGTDCEGPSQRHSTCIAEQCSNVPRLTIKEFADKICTRAKEVDGDLTGSGMQKISSDAEEACLVWCEKRNGSTRSRGWTFPDGTTCQIRRNRYGKSNYCIKGRCEEFVCDPLEEAAFAQSPDFCPNDRFDNDLSWRTGLRGREGAVRWKSASGCHYNCISPGSGIRLVKNKKYNRSSIQLCRPDKFGCSRVKTPYQHASMICSKYKEKVRRLSGLGMQISPAVEDPDRSCRVACQDDFISHRFYLVNGEDGWFPFGTDCSKGMAATKKAYCVSGKCLEFGTDDTPLSESEFTLALLSRPKRSLYNNTSTKISMKLNQTQLDDIIKDLHRILSGNFSSNEFNIDLNNPVHVNMLEDKNMPQSHVQLSTSDEYVNLA
ncbi:A disintegrin and metalloproteinase with thrombospondin motifs adt-1-like isoform X1 [Diorhabda sublineata]|uniref:A disintegrin and metalloproteinase with thrombospondin motifs adt-1-like isoform X1 n=2 Tax=Diorhabda sublineata TaxID=1163346 RepID=UPI0024E103AF|nr:A disintegrin and metalloproteinase with thrombospondin motifs adt-1-like isoform X1 [Diorhabda sublineata]